MSYPPRILVLLPPSLSSRCQPRNALGLPCLVLPLLFVPRRHVLRRWLCRFNAPLLVASSTAPWCSVCRGRVCRCAASTCSSSTNRAVTSCRSRCVTSKHRRSQPATWLRYGAMSRNGSRGRARPPSPAARSRRSRSFWHRVHRRYAASSNGLARDVATAPASVADDPTEFAQIHPVVRR